MKYWWALIGIAIFLFMPGLLFLGVGIDMMTSEPTTNDQGEEEDPSDAGCMSIFICTPIFWLPALLLLYLGLQGYRGRDNLDDVSSLLNTYDEISIGKMAEILEMPQAKAEKKMIKCIKEGLVQGRIEDGIYYSRHKWEAKMRADARLEELQDLADILIAYRRVEISRIADKIGRTVPETERLILETLEEGLVDGYISRKQHVFFTRDYLEQIDDVRMGWVCDNCGAVHDELLLPGEVGKCTYCGSLSKARGTMREKDVKFEVIEL